MRQGLTRTGSQLREIGSRVQIGSQASMTHRIESRAERLMKRAAHAGHHAVHAGHHAVHRASLHVHRSRPT
eukprot:250726-Prymnesium_polylepis.2